MIRTAALLTALAGSVSAQVPYERLVMADSEPHHWLTYSGNYASHRFSSLAEIDTSNVHRLRVEWAYQVGGGELSYPA